MKKTLAIVCTLLMVVMLASACSHHTCPAYRGSIADASYSAQ